MRTGAGRTNGTRARMRDSNFFEPESLRERPAKIGIKSIFQQFLSELRANHKLSVLGPQGHCLVSAYNQERFGPNTRFIVSSSDCRRRSIIGCGRIHDLDVVIVRRHV